MILLQNFTGDNSISGIRKISTDMNFLYSYCDLTDVDNMLLTQSGSADRRLEILNVRALIKECGLDLKITYKKRKPIVENGFISISHSDSLAAIVWHPTKEYAIDIEEFSGRTERISKRAFSETELNFATNDSFKLNILWNIKECVYKLANIQGLDFKAQIKVEPFVENSQIKASLITAENTKEFIFNSGTILNHSFVWGCEV